MTTVNMTHDTEIRLEIILLASVVTMVFKKAIYKENTWRWGGLYSSVTFIMVLAIVSRHNDPLVAHC